MPEISMQPPVLHPYLVEYTPQAYVASDLDNFAETYDKNLVGKRPNLVSIDGG